MNSVQSVVRSLIFVLAVFFWNMPSGLCSEKPTFLNVDKKFLSIINNFQLYNPLTTEGLKTNELIDRSISGRNLMLVGDSTGDKIIVTGIGPRYTSYQKELLIQKFGVNDILDVVDIVVEMLKNLTIRSQSDSSPSPTCVSKVLCKLPTDQLIKETINELDCDLSEVTAGRSLLISDIIRDSLQLSFLFNFVTTDKKTNGKFVSKNNKSVFLALAKECTSTVLYKIIARTETPETEETEIVRVITENEKYIQKLAKASLKFLLDGIGILFEEIFEAFPERHWINKELVLNTLKNLQEARFADAVQALTAKANINQDLGSAPKSAYGYEKEKKDVVVHSFGHMLHSEPLALIWERFIAKIPHNIMFTQRGMCETCNPLMLTVLESTPDSPLYVLSWLPAVRPDRTSNIEIDGFLSLPSVSEAEAASATPPSVGKTCFMLPINPAVMRVRFADNLELGSLIGKEEASKQVAFKTVFLSPITISSKAGTNTSAAAIAAYNEVEILQKLATDLQAGKSATTCEDVKSFSISPLSSGTSPSSAAAPSSSGILPAKEKEEEKAGSPLARDFSETEQNMGYRDTGKVCIIEGRGFFRIIDVRGDGSCGYYSLGITRKEAVKKLQEALLDQKKGNKIKGCLAKDIKDAVINQLPLADEFAAKGEEYQKIQEKLSSAQKTVNEWLQKNANIPGKEVEDIGIDELITKYGINKDDPNFKPVHEHFLQSREELKKKEQEIEDFSRTDEAIKVLLTNYIALDSATYYTKFEKFENETWRNNWLDINGGIIEAVAVSMEISIVIVDQEEKIIRSVNNEATKKQYVEYNGVDHFRRLEEL